MRNKNRIRNVLAIVAMCFILLPLFFVRPMVVHGSSMSPTIKDGDIVFYAKPKERYFLDTIVIAEHNGRTDIKRVVGRPGDYIEVIDGFLITSDSRVTEIFDTTLDNGMSWNVPKDHYFIVGDNREVSNDSRHYGAVPVENIKGFVVAKTTSLKFLFFAICGITIFSILFKPNKSYLFWCIIRAELLIAYPIWVMINLIDGAPLHCAYRTATGLLCPGCGLTTMMQALMRFDIVAAFQANMFAMLSIPVVIYIAYKFVKFKELPKEVILYSWVVLLVLWILLRNKIGV